MLIQEQELCNSKQKEIQLVYSIMEGDHLIDVEYCVKNPTLIIQITLYRRWTGFEFLQYIDEY